MKHIIQILKRFWEWILSLFIKKQRKKEKSSSSDKYESSLSNSFNNSKNSLEKLLTESYKSRKVTDKPKKSKCVTNGNKELLDFCHAYRRAVKESEISSIFSYRALSAFTRLENELSLDSIFKMCLLKGMREDELAVIKAKITNYAKSQNKYLNTFLNL